MFKTTFTQVFDQLGIDAFENVAAFSGDARADIFITVADVGTGQATLYVLDGGES